ncbi:MAG: DUF3500 domain-containing protein [Planctomycetes bacterium]|nr:DUF3500 domain-containing protein [Planctomycetota bacterium]
MATNRRLCPDCGTPPTVNRRQFIQRAGVAGAAVALPILSLPNVLSAAPSAGSYGGKPAESLVKVLYDSLSDEQKKEVCFAWDHIDPKMGLLRTRVANNWHITKPIINSKFYTDDQRAMVRGIFENIIQPDWHARIDTQLEDDAGGFGEEQNFAIFGKPGDGKFEFVMTGRHMTMRCDGNSAEHVAFGGPIFYGHAAEGFDEPADHKGNVFWHQGLEANKLFSMMDAKQQQASLVKKLPNEARVDFRGTSGGIPGIPVTEFSSDQKTELQRVLQVLIEPYRQSDRDKVAKCLKAQGGLDKCSLAFYSDGDIGNDKVWDCWRLEGPSFVWYFRGTPHVHVWVHVADDPAVKLNA